MKLAWATDIHLDHLEQKVVDRFLESLSSADADALVITGDIADGKTVVKFLRRMYKWFDRPIYYVLGNHDYWHTSIPEVRLAMEDLRNESNYRLCYLTTTPFFYWLNHSVESAIIGHDGWYDARNGNHRKSPIMLNDWHFTRDFLGLHPKDRIEKFRYLATESAQHVTRLAHQAFMNEKCRNLVVATHVPPFRQAATYQGKVSDDDWQPWMSSRTMGDALYALATQYPDRQIQVLCGHSHGGSDFYAAPNLRVMTGQAEYGEPKLQGIYEVR